MQDTRERLIRYLGDAWAVEKSLVGTLQDMADEVDNPQVRDCFLEHRGVTHQQEEMLEARIRALGEEPSGGKGFFNQMMSKVGDVLHGSRDPYEKAVQDLIKAFATENFEIAMYESLALYSDSIGDTETAQLARTIQAQEKEAALRVWGLIQSAATIGTVQPIARAA